jgi:hypothetical protein
VGEDALGALHPHPPHNHPHRPHPQVVDDEEVIRGQWKLSLLPGALQKDKEIYRERVWAA